MPEYPECAKLIAVSEESQIIGEFLDSTPYVLAEYVTFEGHDRATLTPVSSSIEDILSKYFGIDMNKVEAERRQMLDNIRDEH